MTAGALIPAAAPMLPIPGELTETGLTLPPGLAYEEWERVGHLLQRVEKSVRWWIGDWIRYGERTYGEMYTQAIEVTGHSYQDLADMAYVARAVDFSDRSEKLSWSHHKAVAALEPEARRQWLATAETEQLSRRELQRRIKGTSDKPSIPACNRCGQVCNWCRIILTPDSELPGRRGKR